MRTMSIKKKSVRATSAYHEEPFKGDRVPKDKFLDVCLNCTKEECVRGNCEKTRRK